MDIPDGTYKFHISNDMLFVTVNAKIIKDFPEPYATAVSAEDFELQIYDSQGNPIKNAEGADIYMELVNIDNLAHSISPGSDSLNFSNARFSGRDSYIESTTIPYLRVTSKALWASGGNSP